MQGTAIAQPNIALIKYWGKRDIARNLPAVGSISITLRELHTRMQVEFDDTLAKQFKAASNYTKFLCEAIDVPY